MTKYLSDSVYDADLCELVHISNLREGDIFVFPNIDVKTYMIPITALNVAAVMTEGDYLELGYTRLSGRDLEHEIENWVTELDVPEVWKISLCISVEM